MRRKPTKREKVAKRKPPRLNRRKTAGKKRPSRPRGRPARTWTGPDMAAILTAIGEGATLTDVAEDHGCCRKTLRKLITRDDFFPAYRAALDRAIIRGELTMYSEGIGGRPIVKTTVETNADGHVAKTTITREIAGPNVGALSKYLAAKAPNEWGDIRRLELIRGVSDDDRTALMVRSLCAETEEEKEEARRLLLRVGPGSVTVAAVMGELFDDDKAEKA